MLPSAWVSEIFSRMAMNYGSKFDAMWAGVDPEKLRYFWARELGAFDDLPASIAHALNNLPDDKPPTLGEFRKLCALAPLALPERIDGPEANPELVREIVRRRRVGSTAPPWAEALRARQAAGARLTAHQRVMLERAK